MRKHNIPGIFIFVFLMLFLTSCDLSQQPYSTVCDIEQLKQLIDENHKICLVSFTVDSTLYKSDGKKLDVYPGGLIPEIEAFVASEKEKDDFAKKITGELGMRHYRETCEFFSTKFNLVGNSTYNKYQRPITETSQIIKLIKKANAEYGLLIHDQFGWDWHVENTGISYFFFKSYTIIYDKQGNVAWKFIAKGLKSHEELSITNFIEGFFGTVFFDTVIKALKSFCENYARFIYALILEDTKGELHKSRVSDYLELEKKFDKYLIYNGNDKRYLPKFRDVRSLTLK